jgi:hypothetical protein
MEILFIAFVALIFFVSFAMGSKQPGRARRNLRQSDFRTYFVSLPQETQLNFIDNLDELQRMQFEHMIEDEHFRYDENMVNEFNEWTQQEEHKSIAPYEHFESNNYEYNESYNDGDYSNYSDNSSTDYGNSSDSWSSSDSSSYSDSSSVSSSD